MAGSPGEDLSQLWNSVNSGLKLPEFRTCNLAGNVDLAGNIDLTVKPEQAMD